MAEPQKRPEAESNVRALPRQAPAIGVSTTLAVGPDRQLVLQGFVAIEDGEGACDEMLDRLFRHVDRIKAIYDIRELETEIEELEKKLNYRDEDLAGAEQRYLDAKEGRLDKIAALKADATKVFEDSYAAHVKTGRSGNYEPRGPTKQAIRAKETEIAQLTVAQEKDDAERAQHQATLKDQRKRWADEIDSRRRGIEKRTKIIGAPKAGA